MQHRHPGADAGDQLHQSTERDEHRQRQMDADDKIPERLFGDIAVRHEPVPGFRVAAHRRRGIERRHREHKDHLADRRDPDPEAGGRFQGGVGK